MKIAQKQTAHRHRPLTAQRAVADATQPSDKVTNNPEHVLAATLASEIARRITVGGSDISGPQSNVVLDCEAHGYRVIVTRSREAGDNNAALSPREREIARMIAKGYPNKTVAAVLEISAWTVGTHLRRMFAKLGVKNRAAMVARLIDLRYGD